jgi:hypothetical protein
MMKKISIKMKHEAVCLLDEWLQASLEAEANQDAQLVWAECCVVAVLTSWRLSKVHPKTHFYVSEKVSFKLDAGTAFGLMHLIDLYPIPVTTYLGNELLRINNEINQFFH